MNELPAQRQRRRATVRQLREEADGAESYEESRERVDSIDDTGSERTESYDGSGSDYVGAVFMG